MCGSPRRSKASLYNHKASGGHGPTSEPRFVIPGTPSGRAGFSRSARPLQFVKIPPCRFQQGLRAELRSWLSKLLPFIKSPTIVIVILACPKRYTLNSYVHRKRDNRDSSVNRTSQLVAGPLPSFKPTADVSSAVSGPELRVRKRHSFPLRICIAPERPLVPFRSYDYRHQPNHHRISY